LWSWITGIISCYPTKLNDSSNKIEQEQILVSGYEQGCQEIYPISDLKLPALPFTHKNQLPKPILLEAL